MPVSGLVVTLARPEALALLAADPRLTFGEPKGLFVPAVLETATLEEAESAVEALMESELVRFVDVVTVDFSDGLEATELAPTRQEAVR
jgi:hypothetical protein